MAYFGQLLNPIFLRSTHRFWPSDVVILHLASARLIIPVLFLYLCSMPTSLGFPYSFTLCAQ